MGHGRGGKARQDSAPPNRTRLPLRRLCPAFSDVRRTRLFTTQQGEEVRGVLVVIDEIGPAMR